MSNNAATIYSFSVIF